MTFEDRGVGVRLSPLTKTVTVVVPCWVDTGVGAPCAMGFPTAVAAPCGIGALVTSGRSIITGGIVVHPDAEGPGMLVVLEVFDWLCVGEYEGAGGVGCGVETTGVDVGVDVAVGVGVEVGATTI